MYAKQKLYEAVMSLVGLGPIQDRLTHAALPLVVLQNPSTDLPEELRKEFDDVVRALTVKPLSDEKSYTARDLSDDAANDLAQRILGLFTRVMGGL